MSLSKGGVWGGGRNGDTSRDDREGVDISSQQCVMEYLANFDMIRCETGSQTSLVSDD